MTAPAARRSPLPAALTLRVGVYRLCLYHQPQRRGRRGDRIYDCGWRAAQAAREGTCGVQGVAIIGGEGRRYRRY